MAPDEIGEVATVVAARAANATARLRGTPCLRCLTRSPSSDVVDLHTVVPRVRHEEEQAGGPAQHFEVCWLVEPGFGPSRGSECLQHHAAGRELNQSIPIRV